MDAQITKVRRFGPYAHITFYAPGLAKKAKPGQFVEVKIEGPNAPFWRRPFCICRADAAAGTIDLLIKSVGTGSRLISAREAGERVDILGPLGNGFKVPGRGPVILVGGGFGVAPLLFLAERLKTQGRPAEVLIGGRCEDDLLLRKEMKLAGALVACSTEDGSAGHRGRVTELLEQRLKAFGKTRVAVAAAGPKPMLAAVAELAAEYGVAAEVSLEEVMACGLGVCNGCVVKVAGEYRRVCKDGPVFAAHEIEWAVAR